MGVDALRWVGRRVQQLLPQCPKPRLLQHTALPSCFVTISRAFSVKDVAPSWQSRLPCCSLAGSARRSIHADFPDPIMSWRRPCLFRQLLQNLLRFVQGAHPEFAFNACGQFAPTHLHPGAYSDCRKLLLTPVRNRQQSIIHAYSRPVKRRLTGSTLPSCISRLTTTLVPRPHRLSYDSHINCCMLRMLINSSCTNL